MSIFRSEDPKKRLEKRSFVTLVLGIMTLISAGIYLVYHYQSEKAYREKWKDYDNCGII